MQISNTFLPVVRDGIGGDRPPWAEGRGAGFPPAGPRRPCS